MTLMGVGKYEPRWDRDLDRGQQAEMFVERLVAMLRQGNGQIETKRDAWWPLRRRLYVEHWCKRNGVYQASGLQTTGALIWLFLAPQEFGFLIPTDHLRRAVAFSIERDPRNGNAYCDTGSHPTKGVYIYEHDIFESRDKTRDEH